MAAFVANKIKLSLYYCTDYKLEELIVKIFVTTKACWTEPCSRVAWRHPSIRGKQIIKFARIAESR